MIKHFENFINENKMANFVLLPVEGDEQEGMEFLNKDQKPILVNSIDIIKMWNKSKADESKFAEMVFAEYPDVYQINHTSADSDGEQSEVGSYINRETKKWSGFFC